MNTREKLLLLWALTATVLLVVGGGALWQMLQPPLARLARLGGYDDFPIGAVTLLECDRSVSRCSSSNLAYALTPSEGYVTGNAGDLVRIWVTHDAANEWRAFSAVSTHLGCFVKWNVEQERFEDPCGGAKWTRDGKYYEGPAPRDLDFFAIEFREGQLFTNFKLTRGKAHD